MADAGYCPERGDAIWLDFDPQSGREQAGRRPALVLSPAVYNEKVGLALVCPITSRVKGYPFESVLPPHKALAGVVLADHARSLDWRARRAQFICRLPASVWEDVSAKIVLLISAGE